MKKINLKFLTTILLFEVISLFFWIKVLEENVSIIKYQEKIILTLLGSLVTFVTITLLPIFDKYSENELFGIVLGILLYMGTPFLFFQLNIPYPWIATGISYCAFIIVILPYEIQRQETRE